ncbi:hypothetical protein HBI29_095240 [Parastagonospora nodorum]|nr:hypothetical protein HBI71_179170 [Parastagonospora nodorum]KAH5327263.1 hypothetical protein HBI12_078880 [Parastagonospora nodorum]KAH5407113.1 hypothetical protein HBI47_172620 [Parastagonospora nodorum]KAH5514878.1 hypothetical protein HBI29_095240 [Parastagonospora nodorum]KAH5654358.1 hypothetical protein HBI51_055360 [Parastagonospora nodorum]
MEHTTRKSSDAEDTEENDVSSETSSIRYDHEPFETFREKIGAVAAELLDTEVNCIDVERMKGGSSNRVVGFQAHALKTKRHCSNWLQKCLRIFQRGQTQAVPDKYIVRISRYDSKDLERQLAILKVAKDRLPLPVPEVMGYDLTSDNILGKPYMIQKRIPGRLVTSMLQELNLEQKVSVAKQVTGLVSRIASLKAASGEISVDNLTAATSEPVCVDKYGVPRGETVKATPQKPIDHLLDQCEIWRQFQISKGYCFEDIWDSFVAISRALEARGFLGEECVLVHGDFREYNILAKICSPTGVHITGIIDWDDAHFAPSFMAYRSPFWLWTAEDAESDVTEDEKTALLDPVNEEDQIMKQTFLDYASQEYKRLAFAPEAMLARRMYHLLRKGIFGDWSMMEADAVISEWDELHPEDAVVVIDDEIDVESEAEANET